MTEQEARELAKNLVAPAGALGFLLGRVPLDQNSAVFATWRRAVGNVMGNVYMFLQPIWDAYPHLDPGTHKDPFGLAGREHETTTAQTSALLRCLDEIEVASDAATEKFRTCIEAQPNGIRWLEDAAAELQAAVREARDVIDAAPGGCQPPACTGRPALPSAR